MAFVSQVNIWLTFLKVSKSPSPSCSAKWILLFLKHTENEIKIQNTEAGTRRTKEEQFDYSSYHYKFTTVGTLISNLKHIQVSESMNLNQNRFRSRNFGCTKASLCDYLQVTEKKNLSMYAYQWIMKLKCNKRIN